MRPLAKHLDTRKTPPLHNIFLQNLNTFYLALFFPKYIFAFLPVPNKYDHVNLNKLQIGVSWVAADLAPRIKDSRGR